jgi:hypothetical protein
MANYRRNVVNVGKRDDVAEMAANLALISAAPELLAALEMIIKTVDDFGSLNNPHWKGWEQAHAAIFKANKR